MASLPDPELLKRYAAASSSTRSNAGTGHKGKKGLKANTSGMRIVDDDVDLASLAPKRSAEDESEWDDFGEDKPALVDMPIAVSSKAATSSAATSSVLNAWTDVSSSSARAADRSPPRRRADTANDEHVPRRSNAARPAAGASNDASPPRRGRHDSDDDVPRRPTASVSQMAGGTRQRHDSDDDTDVPRRPSANRFNAAASNHNEASNPRVSAGLSSAAGAEADVPRKRQRHDSDDEGEPPRRPAAASKPGAAAGAGTNDTVYRDKQGRKVDMAAELEKRQQTGDQQAANKQIEKYEWQTGAVQKERAKAAAAELAKLEEAPFARMAGDADLERRLKARLRDGDPMAGLVSSSSAAAGDDGAAGGSTSKRKPLYSGPAPPPNRYGIRPGYRWDGIDRGNGWEAKLISTENARKVKEHKQQMWSVSDL